MRRHLRTVEAFALAILIALVLIALGTCGGGQHPATTTTLAPTATPAAGFEPLVDPGLQLLVTPSPEGHQPFIRAIDGARA